MEYYDSNIGGTYLYNVIFGCMYIRFDDIPFDMCEGICAYVRHMSVWVTDNVTLEKGSSVERTIRRKIFAE